MDDRTALILANALTDLATEVARLADRLETLNVSRPQPEPGDESDPTTPPEPAP